MLRVITSIAVLVSFLAFGGISNAITLDEAKAKVEKEATDKGLTARERAEAIIALQDLVEKGVPVEYAYQVTGTCIDKGIRGEELSRIVRFIKSVPPDARDEAATVATAAITHNYSPKDIVKVVVALDAALKEGAEPEMAEKVVAMCIDKGLSSDAVKKTAKNYGNDIKKGTMPDKAMEHAARYSDKIDSGFGAGAGMGGGSGFGAGAGMGGRR